MNRKQALLESLRREWRTIRSRRIYLLGMVVIPLVGMLSLLSIMSSGLPKDLPIAVVDLDNSSSSRALTRQLDAMDQTEVVYRLASYAEASRLMREGRIYGIVVIHKAFQADVMASRQPLIQCYTNNSYMMAGGLLYRDFRTLVELASGKVLLSNGLARGKSEQALMVSIMPLKVTSNVIGNQNLNYEMYITTTLLPGLLSLLVLQLTVFSITIEIKNGTARDWLETSGGSMTLALMGKLMVQFAFWAASGISCLLLLYGYNGFTLSTGFLPMLLAMLLLIMASQALGVVFATLLPAPRLSLSLSSLFGMLSFSLSAFSFPAMAMLPPVRALTMLVPLRYYSLISIDQALSGRPWSSSSIYYAALLCYVVLALWAVPTLKRLVKSVKYIS